MSKTSSGHLGEELAHQYLLKAGYKILARNFRTKTGEIDLVAIENNCLVFVEVKTRWSDQFGIPEEAINRFKLASIARTGEYFRLTKEGLPEASRIDVVAIEVERNNKIKRIEIHRSVTA